MLMLDLTQITTYEIMAFDQLCRLLGICGAVIPTCMGGIYLGMIGDGKALHLVMQRTAVLSWMSREEYVHL